jgi:hypothetical protein
MDKNTKAKAIIDAVEKTVEELRAQGKNAMADQTEKAFKDFPVGSLARLYDLVVTFRTRREALEALGADA